MRGFRKTTEEFIVQARLIHGNKYDYSKTQYLSAMRDVEVICPKHGIFFQISASHLSGRGCAKCCGNIKKSTIEVIAAIQSIHGDKYDCSKVVYTGNKNPFILICPRHGEFKAWFGDLP